MEYSELHCLSHFSFLRGASSPESLVKRASELNYHSLAITDECSFAGVVRAHVEAKKHNISLIIGSEFQNQQGLFVVLLAQDRQAYGQISALITKARGRCEKGEYQVHLDDLDQSLSQSLLLWKPSGQESLDSEYASHLKSQFTSMWILAERQLTQGDKGYMAYLHSLSEEYKLPVVAAGNVHMSCADEQPLQHVMTAIRLRTQVDKLGLRACSNQELAMRHQSKLQKLFPKRWLAETKNIASLCHFSMDELRYEYPAEVVPDGYSTAMDYLKDLVEEGKKWRFPSGVPQDIEQIIDKELRLIEEQGYEYFFLTIYDIVQFAQSQNILYQGRGSAANSIVCYCLGITAVDPEKVSVLFERFISKERNEPPDIDVDFEHQRREEVIQYIYQKYGHQRAALAATVITYRFKSAVREVGKALGFEESQLDFFIKNVDRRDTKEGWLTQLIGLGLDPNSHKAQQFISLVTQIKGAPRHLSQHVGGFVISAGPLSELVPTENAAMEGRTVIQWDKDDLEALHLLKVDILALGMLTAIRKCFHLVEAYSGQPMNMASVIWEDAKVYRMLHQADSIGVFQIESRAQMSMLPRLKPVRYYDLVIQVAIVRPGPIQGDMVHPYLRRRDGLEPVEYPSEQVRAVLERTNGVPIFQEQVIQLAMVAAGFSGGEADQLRRSMASWRRNGTPEKFKDKLISGMLARGYEKDFAERIYLQICGFGEYGFPESHAASFALLAYVSAWLKYYYPAAYCCALLNSQPMGFYSPSQLIQDLRRHGVTVKPVDINKSHWDHTLEFSSDEEPELRLGFRLVKGLSQTAVEQIVERRSLNEITHLQQLHELALPKNIIEALASSGSLSNITGHRYQARWEAMLTEERMPLFKTEEQFKCEYSLSPPSSPESMREDYASLGLSLDYHPISILRSSGRLKNCLTAEQLKDVTNNSYVTVAGAVTGRQRPGTASGVTFMTLEDDTGNVNVVVWEATARGQRKAFLRSTVLLVKGKLERQGDVIHVIAGKLVDMSHHLNALSISSRDFH